MKARRDTFRRRLHYLSRRFQRILGRKPDLKDLYVYSYPKSGRTWLRIMLDRLNNSEMTIAYVHGDAAPIKMRHFSKMKFNLNRLRDRKVIFLVRDPRDTVVSAYYDAMYRERIYEGDISEFIRHPKFGIEKVLSFHQICFENKSLVTNSIVLSYESLKEDTAGEMQKIFDFLDWRIPKEKLDETIEYASFNNMKHMEQTGAIEDRYSYALSPGDQQNPQSFKVRRGKVGGYKSELGEADMLFCDEIMKTRPNPFYPL